MEQNIKILSQGPLYVAVFKPHNIAVVGGRGVVRPTLLDVMRKMFGTNIFAVHRLDRVTSGITVFARSMFAKHAMENAFKKRLVKKTYYAVCEGKPDFKTKTVKESLKKIDLLDKKSGPVAKQIIHQEGQQAITNIRILTQLDERHCLVEATPISGRMHQIRIHLASLSLPIVGDKLYGASSPCGFNTIALCAVAIAMPLPKGGLLKVDIRHLFNPHDYLPKA